ncbi:TPA: hypothetical protein QDB06_005208 [Burkholderia vietnamiensis]|nr:hypothetical protein [Burkholderia vietnamiensis]
MPEWKLLTIEYGARVIEAKYREGRLAGFIAREKQDDKIPGFRLRERLADLLIGLAGLINKSDVDLPVRINVINAKGIGEGSCPTENDSEGAAIDDAREAIPVESKDSAAANFHFDLDRLGWFAKPGRKVIVHIPS